MYVFVASLTPTRRFIPNKKLYQFFEKIKTNKLQYLCYFWLEDQILHKKSDYQLKINTLKMIRDNKR